jgi:hypothetical protein
MCKFNVLHMTSGVLEELRSAFLGIRNMEYFGDELTH